MSALTASASSADPSEIEKFSALAEQWWDPGGKFAPLHKLNPVRLAFIRAFASSHFERDDRSVRCFEGLSLLDLGCGGGLLSEPMARLGFDVTGIDPAERNVRIAQSHAETSGLKIAYQAATAEELVAEGRHFDVVLNMEVVEHVADLRGYLRASAALVVPRGLMFVATINRTVKSLAFAKIAAEYILGWLPVGTHDWNRFVSPQTLRRLLEESGLSPLKTQGASFDPIGWNWRLSSDVDVNYMVVARR